MRLFWDFTFWGVYVNVYGLRLNSITIFAGPYKDTTLVMLALLL